MKIIVIDPKEKTNLRLRIPNWIVFSNLGSHFLTKTIQHKNQSIDSQALQYFFKEFRNISKPFKGLEIVDIQSSNGEIIQIIL